MPLQTIAFDADDTLWHNEEVFRLTQDRFAELLEAYAPGDHLRSRLMEAEERNLGHYGFGVKGFVLSMIETAIEVTDGRVPAAVISDLIAAGREMLDHPIELLPDARNAVEALAPDFALWLITKGDLLDQERKLAQSGLGELFDGVEIVSDKTPTVYARIFETTPGGPEGAMMVGNSMKSDVLPPLAVGAWGVHVPYHTTWSYEHAPAPMGAHRFRELGSLAALPALIADLSR